MSKWKQGLNYLAVRSNEISMSMVPWFVCSEGFLVLVCWLHLRNWVARVTSVMQLLRVTPKVCRISENLTRNCNGFSLFSRFCGFVGCWWKEKRVDLILCQLPLTQWVCWDLRGHGLPEYLKQVFWVSLNWPSSPAWNTALQFAAPQRLNPMRYVQIHSQRSLTAFLPLNMGSSLRLPLRAFVSLETWKYKYERKISVLYYVFLSAEVGNLSCSNHQRKLFGMEKWMENHGRKQAPWKRSLWHAPSKDILNLQANRNIVPYWLTSFSRPKLLSGAGILWRWHAS